MDDRGKVAYVDGNGSRLLLGANNIKDAVVVSYLFMDAGFDGHEAVRDALVIDVWQMMNPDLVLEESEIYTCPGGCEIYHYSCDLQSDLTEIERLKAEGVVFFGDLEECGQEPEETKAEDTGCLCACHFHGRNFQERGDACSTGESLPDLPAGV